MTTTAPTTEQVGPHRVQLSRKKGWRMPENTVSVARPTGYGNSFHVGLPANPTAADCVRRFRDEQAAEYDGAPLERLRGKNLARWCKLSDPCHADVLLELANPDCHHLAEGRGL